jgi:NADPH:quinone reductase-like Zn-dependent oxidoreductase
MKAAVIINFGNPEVFEISNISEPVIKENEILIEVVSGSVNPIDWKQRRGNHRFIFGSPFPIVLGYDVAGTVVKTGIKVSDFNNGDRVCGVLNNKYGGGLGQFAKGTGKCFAKVPANIDVIISAALPLSGVTALQALRDLGKIRKGDKVLIIGAAGGVGHYAVQISAIFGAEIHAVSSIRHKGFVENLAVVHFIDYLKTDILKLSHRFNIVFDTVGKYSFPKCRHLLLPGGTYINTLPRLKILVHKIISLFTKGKKVKTFLMKHNSKDLAQLVEWIENGKLKIFIDKEFSINNVAQAHEYSELGHTEGKILIRYFWL